MTSTLQKRILEARSLLSEGPTVHSDFAGKVAKYWGVYVEYGPKIQEAVRHAAHPAHEAALASDDKAMHKALTALAHGMALVTEVGGKTYGAFAGGRANMYECAKVWGVSTKGAGKGGHSPVSLSELDANALLKQTVSAANDFGVRAAKMMHMGNVVVHDFHDIVDQVVDNDAALKLVSEALVFRDQQGTAMFMTLNSIMRRLNEMVLRNWNVSVAQKAESRSQYRRMVESAPQWKAPWAHDPEIGNREL